MVMEGFRYQDLFPLEADETEYRPVTADHVSTTAFEGEPVLKIAPEGLTRLSEEAFKDVSHFYRGAHLRQLADIVSDLEASENDRYVALEMLKNAVTAAEGILPMCQDTGTAVIIGKKGQQVWTTGGGRDEEALSRGVYLAYTRNHFRYSQNAPLSMYEEINTGSNLPAQIELYAVQGDAYDFLFIAKGGGSANKTFLYQETKAILDPGNLTRFMTEKMRSLGAAACPPYHLVFVVGGTSAEANLKTVKLATAGYLDRLPRSGNERGRAFRDDTLEAQLLDISRKMGIGAQFGGKYFCHDVRVIRLPRHGASCPIGIGVSCSADRNIKARITKDGLFLEKLETDPVQYLPTVDVLDQKSVHLDLDRPMNEILEILSKQPVSTRLRLSGNIVVARDIAHAKIKERLDTGGGLPRYFKDHIIYYAGPAKTPEGYPSGAFGPTTAGRMDPYVPLFQKHGGSMVMLAKGNRTRMVKDACEKYGGFYLGSIGGPAARLAKDCIRDVQVLEYPELGMEAVFMISVEDFPAFVIIDDKGNDFFESIQESQCSS